MAWLDLTLGTLGQLEEHAVDMTSLSDLLSTLLERDARLDSEVALLGGEEPSLQQGVQFTVFLLRRWLEREGDHIDMAHRSQVRVDGVRLCTRVAMAVKDALLKDAELASLRSQLKQVMTTLGAKQEAVDVWEASRGMLERSLESMKAVMEVAQQELKQKQREAVGLQAKAKLAEELGKALETKDMQLSTTTALLEQAKKEREEAVAASKAATEKLTEANNKWADLERRLLTLEAKRRPSNAHPPTASADHQAVTVAAASAASAAPAATATAAAAAAAAGGHSHLNKIGASAGDDPTEAAGARPLGEGVEMPPVPAKMRRMPSSSASASRVPPPLSAPPISPQSAPSGSLLSPAARAFQEALVHSSMREAMLAHRQLLTMAARAVLAAEMQDDCVLTTRGLQRSVAARALQLAQQVAHGQNSHVPDVVQCELQQSDMDWLPRTDREEKKVVEEKRVEGKADGAAEEKVEAVPAGAMSPRALLLSPQLLRHVSRSPPRYSAPPSTRSQRSEMVAGRWERDLHYSPGGEEAAGSMKRVVLQNGLHALYGSFAAPMEGADARAGEGGARAPGDATVILMLRLLPHPHVLRTIHHSFFLDAMTHERRFEYFCSMYPTLSQQLAAAEEQARGFASVSLPSLSAAAAAAPAAATPPRFAPEADALRTLLQLLLAVRHLHRHGIAHGQIGVDSVHSDKVTGLVVLGGLTAVTLLPALEGRPQTEWGALRRDREKALQQDMAAAAAVTCRLLGAPATAEARAAAEQAQRERGKQHAFSYALQALLEQLTAKQVPSADRAVAMAGVLLWLSHRVGSMARHSDSDPFSPRPVDALLMQQFSETLNDMAEEASSLPAKELLAQIRTLQTHSNSVVARQPRAEAVSVVSRA